MHRHSLELCFSGIAFTFEGPSHLLECLALALAGPRPFGVLGRARDDVFARVRCSVAQIDDAKQLQEGESPTSGRRLAFGLSDNGFRGHAEGATAWVARTPADGVEAQLRPTPQAARNLLELLTCLLVQRDGGAVLHAAAIELPEGVAAFVGPSGAGKSTSCEHVAGARLFSVDRLAVVPARASETRDGRGWSAHPFPGGSALTKPLPSSEAQGRPLLGILRICKAPVGHRFETGLGSRAIGWLRQSTFQLGRDRRAELELLSALEKLATEVKVGELHFALGAALSRPLRSWLELETAPVALDSGQRNERVATDRRLGGWAKGVESGAR